MTAQQTPGEVGEPVEHEQPGDEEMPTPSHGEVALTGYGERPVKAALIELAVGVGRKPEHAGRVEAMTKDGGDAFGAVALLHGFHGGQRIVEGGLRSEIESGMGVEDLQAAHQQEQEHERIDPVGDAHRARMPIDDLAFLHGFSYGRPRIWMQPSRLRRLTPDLLE